MRYLNRFNVVFWSLFISTVLFRDSFKFGHCITVQKYRFVSVSAAVVTRAELATQMLQHY